MIVKRYNNIAVCFNSFASSANTMRFKSGQTKTVIDAGVVRGCGMLMQRPLQALDNDSIRKGVNLLVHKKGSAEQRTESN